MEEKQIPPLRALLTASVFVLLLGGLFLLNLLLPKPDVLESERRRPAGWPELSFDTLLSGGFMDGFARYAADNFTFRDTLRTVRALAVFDIFLQTDKSGLYWDSLAGAGKFEKADEASIRDAAGKIARMAGNFPGSAVYCAAVPDKSNYAGRSYPGFDPEAARHILEMDGITYIDLTGALSAEDYYRTDLHWDQPKLGGVLSALSDAMGFSVASSFTEHTTGIFHGVYAGQLALPIPPDTMTYLTNDILENATVRYLNDRTLAWEDGPIYDLAAAGGRDPYDLFLRGVQPLITIENPSAETGRQLYLFRDSFSSSLAPLLVPYYATITLIDLRYIDSRLLPSFMSFADGADVLFLYSSQILNNAGVLMVE